MDGTKIVKRVYSIVLCLIFSATTFAAQPKFNLDQLTKGEWHLATTNNFEIVSDLDPELLNELAKDLENYRFFVDKVLGLDLIETHERLRVLAISNKIQFEYIGLPEKITGVFSLRPNGYAAVANVTGYKTGLEDLTIGRQVLFHEYNHYLHKFSRNFNKLPLWCKEGFAEYFGSFKYIDGIAYLGTLDVLKRRAKKMLDSEGKIFVDSEHIFKIKTFNVRSGSPLEQRGIDEFYARAAFITHYMNSSPELRKSLDVYLDKVYDGYSEEDALKIAFNRTFSELDGDIKNYLYHNMKVRTIDLAAAGVAFPAVKIEKVALTEKKLLEELGYIFGNTTLLQKNDLREILNRSIELNPDNAELKFLVYSRGVAENPSQVLDELKALQTPPPGFSALMGNMKFQNAQLRRKFGIASGELKALQEAKKYYLDSLRQNPYQADALGGLGIVEDRLNEISSIDNTLEGLLFTGRVTEQEQYFVAAAHLVMKADKGLGALPYIKLAYAYTNNKESSPLLLAKENLATLAALKGALPQQLNDTLLYADGSLYVGQSNNLIPEGKGRFKRANGTVLEGVFIKGLVEGWATLKLADGLIYEGNFSNGIAKGMGKITYRSTDKWSIYEGNLSYAVPQGKGKISSPLVEYTGDFSNGQLQGKGTAKFTQNNVQLTGNWVDGNYIWPVANNIQFSGGFDMEGRAHESGVCLISPATFTRCSYEHGVYRGPITAVEPTENVH